MNIGSKFIINAVQKFTLGSVLIVSAASAAAETALTLKVDNIQSAVGRIFISVYVDKATFLKPEAFLKQTIDLSQALKDGAAETQILLPEGSYAISVFHDANDNGKLDTNFIGIPKEPAGFSNKHVPRFGPPNFKDALITVQGEQQLEVIGVK